MSIVTISRQAGSLGDGLAKAVADALGYEIIEKSKISKSLTDQGFSASDVEKLDERKPSIWQSISAQKKRFSHLVRAAVYELAAPGNVIVLGRGGQVILSGIDGVIHVRVVAPFGTRVERIMRRHNCDEKTAEQIVRHLDHESSGYIRAYFDTDWEDRDHYDIIINTRTISIETGVAMIKCAADSDEFQGGTMEPQQFTDLALIGKVHAAILDIPWLEISNLAAEEGIVTIAGEAGSPAAKEECEKVISAVTGVSKVVNELKVSKKRPPRIV